MCVEKAGIVEQLRTWYGGLGIPILALAGYSSQTYVDEIAGRIERDHRPSVLLYAGDFDPSGADVDRDFRDRLRQSCSPRRLIRVALTDDQVKQYNLPEQMGKKSDPRAAGFIERHGKLEQVELDALPPDILRKLYDEGLAEFWDDSTHQDALEAERRDRSVLATLGNGETGTP